MGLAATGWADLAGLFLSADAWRHQRQKAFEGWSSIDELIATLNFWQVPHLEGVWNLASGPFVQTFRWRDLMAPTLICDLAMNSNVLLLG